MRYRPRTPLLHFFVRWRRDCFFCQIPQQGRAGNVSGEPPYCADHCGYTKKYDPHDIPSYLLDFFQGGKPSDTLSGFISGTSSTMPAGKVYRCRYRRFAIISLSVRFTLPKALYAMLSHMSPCTVVYVFAISTASLPYPGHSRPSPGALGPQTHPRTAAVAGRCPGWHCPLSGSKSALPQAPRPRRKQAGH